MSLHPPNTHHPPTRASSESPTSTSILTSNADENTYLVYTIVNINIAKINSNSNFNFNLSLALISF